MIANKQAVRVSVRNRTALKPARAQRTAIVSHAADNRAAMGQAVAGVAAAILLAVAPAARAEETLNALTGTTPKEELSQTILQDDLNKVNKALDAQPTGAVRQAAQDLKDIVTDQAKDLKDAIAGDSSKLPQGPTKGIGAQKPSTAKAENQAAGGLQANLAQLKSLLGL